MGLHKNASPNLTKRLTASPTASAVIFNGLKMGKIKPQGFGAPAG
jgi:hypothetical protein